MLGYSDFDSRYITPFSDYQRHSREARAISEEYFAAETVLAKILGDMGL